MLHKKEAIIWNHTKKQESISSEKTLKLQKWLEYNLQLGESTTTKDWALRA